MTLKSLSAYNVENSVIFLTLTVFISVNFSVFLLSVQLLIGHCHLCLEGHLKLRLQAPVTGLTINESLRDKLF